MIVPETTDRKNSFWTQANALLLAAMSLPLGLAYAQDYDVVEKRLGKAVSNGELTIEHAHVMLEALKNTDLTPHPPGHLETPARNQKSYQ